MNICLEKITNFNKLNLKNIAKELTFDEFKNIITNKNNIECVKNMINSFNENININPKIFLTSYLICFYPNDLGLTTNNNILDIKIISISEKLINSITFLQSEKDICNIKLYMKEYAEIYMLWSQMDMERSIEQLILSYNNTCEHINIIKSEKKINFEQQIDMIEELENIKNTILCSIKLIDKNFNIKYLKENHSMIASHIKNAREKLTIEIVNNMKKAYYDMISEDIINGDMMSTYNLIKDISVRFLVLCPNNKKDSFKNKFDDMKLLDMLVNIKNDDYDVNIISFIIFMVDFIITMDAPVNDNNNKLWKKEVLSLMTHNISKTLPQILIQIEEHIDTIYSMINDMSQ